MNVKKKVMSIFTMAVTKSHGSWKKTSSLVILIVALLLTMVMPVHASFPYLNSNRYMKTYPMSTLNNTWVYSSSFFSRKIGTIYASDELYITTIGNNWAYCSYPVSYGRKWGYIRLSNITPNNIQHSENRARTRINVYRRYNLSQYYGYVEKGDNVLAVAQKGSATQVIYDIGNGRKKMGWMSTYNYNKYVKASSVSTRTVADGMYEFIGKSGKCVDVSNASTADRANVQLWERNGTNAQKFRVQYLSNGYYRILNVASGKALDVNGGYGDNGTNIQQYTWNNTNAQKWRIVASGDSNYFYIFSAINGKALDINGNGTGNGTNIHLWEVNYSNAQKFRLVSTSEQKPQNIVQNKSQNRNTIISKLVNYERSQVGTSENGNNNIVYNTWYYGRSVRGNGYAWCQAFQSYCMNKCGISTNIVPKGNNCTNVMNWFKNKGLWQWSKYHGGKYTPKAGDMVFYGYSKTSSSHVGLIVGSPVNGYLQVVEGNVYMNGRYQVYEFKANTKRTVHSSYVIGYGTPAY